MLTNSTLTTPLRPQLKSVKPSATLLINERSAAMIKEGKKVYRFGFGQSPFPVPQVVVDALAANAHQKAYQPVFGLQELREAVAAHAKRTIHISAKADQVLIGPGSKELIFGAQLALEADLLLPSPSWVSYEPQATLIGKNIHWIQTNEEENWLVSPTALEAVCNQSESNFKLLILNYPNNPTGTTYSSEDFKNLVNILRKHNVIVVADEIYGEAHHTGSHLSLAQFYPEGTIVSGGLSKWCGAGGWRLGTFVFPEALSWLRDAMRVIASETFSSVAAPIQYAAVTAYTPLREIEEYIENSRAILIVIGKFVHEKLTAANIVCPPPQGGFYLFPNFKNYRDQLSAKGVHNSAQLCEALLNETGVALLPGAAFGRPAEELTARLAYVDFDGEAALNSMKTNDLTPDEFVKNVCPNIDQAMTKMQKEMYLDTFQCNAAGEILNHTQNSFQDF